ncbi:MAG: sulfotransferase family protein [Phycisphaerae bacterium]
MSNATSSAKRDYLTIVSGLPRSGTSMMMRMLSEGGIPPLIDNVRTADEDNPNGYYEFEPVKKTKQDASWLKQASGMVVKMVYRLLYDLPAGYSYRIVFMKRKLEEVIKSQEVMLERHGKAGGASDDEIIALFKSELARCDEWIGQRANFQVLYMDYNELMSSPKPAVQALDAFLGNMNQDAMLHVVDPKLYRQRK